MSDKNDKTDPKTEKAIANVLADAKLDIDPTPFRSFIRNERDLVVVYKALEKAIMRSFAEDLRRNPFGRLAQSGVKESDLQERFKMCETWIRRARGDLGFSLDKTLDLMPHALRCEIDGQTFDPATMRTSIWTPT